MQPIRTHMPFCKFGNHIMAVITVLVCVLTSCARMGEPDGGWYDETPPRVIATTPADQSTNVSTRKINIYFSEYVKIDNATDKVTISPPQLEMPEIKGKGKYISVELKDSLLPNTTYTVDFSDAISDFTESNPLGNYTYTFSTGSVIDTMEVSGNVIQADNMEPVKGILVALYDDMSDSAFVKKPPLRVARTNESGRFVIKGIANGTYRIYALQDLDGNYAYTQRAEMMAFTSDTVTPTCSDDIRQDTIWADSLHIKAINRVGYTHFKPDNIVLRAFTTTTQERYLIKSDRSNAAKFTLYYNVGHAEQPVIRGLDFNSDHALALESSAKRDTLTFWITDTAFVNRDTLQVEIQHFVTDTADVMTLQTDTLMLLAKVSHEKRMQQKARDREEWMKKRDRAQRRGEPVTNLKRPDELVMNVRMSTEMSPDSNPLLVFDNPIAAVDTAKINLYAKHDTLWYKARYMLREWQPPHSKPLKDSLYMPAKRQFELLGEWHQGIEYSLEIDSAAFTDFYGNTSSAFKRGFRVKDNDAFGTLFVVIDGAGGQPVVVQMLNKNEGIVKEVVAHDGIAEFFYINPGSYYLRAFIDGNDNGEWDTGDFELQLQPEEVFYYPESIECKAKWDVTKHWNLRSKPLLQQKPSELIKQKGKTKRQVNSKNLERARRLGISYPAAKEINKNK